jgi:hypothetical protein
LNTYHELENPIPILNQIFQSLVSGGRLVVVDPERTKHDSLAAAAVEDLLRRNAFQNVGREDRFLEQPPGSPWWLIVARKP